MRDGTTLVTLDNTQRVIRHWRLPDGQLLQSNAWNEIEERGCQTARFVPSTQTAAAIDTNGVLHLWDLATKEHWGSIQVNGKNFAPFHLVRYDELFVLSHDRRWLLGGREDGSASLYDLTAARHVRQFQDIDLAGGAAAAFSTDGRWLAYGTTNYAIRIWGLTSQSEQALCRGHLYYVFALRFSLDNRLLASSGWDGHVWLWSVETGKPLVPAFKGHQGPVSPVAFSADGKTLITGSDDRTIRWWNVASRKEMLLFPNTLMIPRVAATAEADFNPGGNLVIWQEFRGPIRAVTLPSLAEIDAREKARLQSP